MKKLKIPRRAWNALKDLGYAEAPVPRSQVGARESRVLLEKGLAMASPGGKIVISPRGEEIFFDHLDERMKEVDSGS